MNNKERALISQNTENVSQLPQDALQLSNSPNWLETTVQDLEALTLQKNCTSKSTKECSSGGTPKTISGVKSVIPHNKHIFEADFVTSPSKRKCYVNLHDVTIESPTKKHKISKSPDIISKTNIKSAKKRLLLEPQESSLQNLKKKINMIIEETKNVDFANIGEDEAHKYFLQNNILDELRLNSENVNKQGGMESIDQDKLLKLFSLLKLNIRGGVPNVVTSNEFEEEQDEFRQTKVRLENVIGGADACLICVNIMTAANMPSRIYSSEIIDEIVSYLNFHISHTISCLDPTYKQKNINLLKKTVIGNMSKDAVLLLHDKVTNIITLLTALLDIKPISKTLASNILTFGIETLFIDNIKEMQLTIMTLLTKIYITYESSQNVLLNVFDTVILLPKNRQNLQTFSLQNKVHIQMLTALILRIVQNFINCETNDSASSIQKAYKKAVNMAHEIVKHFMDKCVIVNDEGKYEPLFQNFLRDIINALCNTEFPAAELLLYIVGSLFCLLLKDPKIKIALHSTILNYLGFIAANMKRQDVLLASQLSIIDNITEKHKQLKNLEVYVNNENEKLSLLKNIFFVYLANRIRNDNNLINTYYFYIAFWHEEQNRKVMALNQTKKKKQNKITFKRNFAELQENLLRNNDPCISADNIIKNKEAKIITTYVASKHCFNDNFNIYLKTIVDGLKDTSMIVRLKSLKCLTEVIAIDSSLLDKSLVQTSLQSCFIDESIPVRELSISSLGKFISRKENLVDLYYKMLLKAIADPVLKIRINAIKILKNVCLQYPNYSKGSEILSQIIKRLDDEGSDETIIEMFENLWFKTENKVKISQKVAQMSNIIRSSTDGPEVFKQLINMIIRPKKLEIYEQIGPSEEIQAAFTQIINFILKNILLNQINGVEREEKILYLLAQVYPQAFTAHIYKLYEFLNLELQSNENVEVITDIIHILELILPTIEDIDTDFLTKLEKILSKLVMKYCTEIDTSCLNCLNIIVNITKNFKPIEDLYFKKFRMVIICKNFLMQNNFSLINEKYKSFFIRIIPVIGALMRLFNFDTTLDEVSNAILFFLNSTDLEIQLCALKAIGSISIKYNYFMNKNELIDFYQKALGEADFPLQLKFEVLLNLEAAILEQERRIQSIKSQENQNMNRCPPINDFIQMHLENIFKSYFNKDNNIRRTVSRIISFITKKAYINPLQVVTHLICMNTDSDRACNTNAKQMLLKINNNHPNFINVKSFMGISLSFVLQKILQSEHSLVRGFYEDIGTQTVESLNGYFYSLVSSNQQKRNALIQYILKQFIYEKNPDLLCMLYMADNLAYFPYKNENELLFIIHEIDKILSSHVINLLKRFEKEKEKTNVADTKILQTYETALQGCHLLFILKDFLIQRFGLNQRQLNYSSYNDTKKSVPLKIKSNSLFEPADIMERLQQNDCFSREELIEQYLKMKSVLAMDEDEEYTE